MRAATADAGVEHLVDQLLGHRIRLEPAHAAAGIQNVKDVVAMKVPRSSAVWLLKQYLFLGSEETNP